MSNDRWQAFLEATRTTSESNAGLLSKAQPAFLEFAKSLSNDERVSLLLHAYERYRELRGCGADFEGSCYSILISSILSADIRPSEREALEILRKSYHQCGHGSDVEPPLELAEKAFRDKPYTDEFFDAVTVYRDLLKPMRTTPAQNTKRKLNWVLWHDPRHIASKCYTSKIQIALRGMSAESAVHWQLLLRNTAAGFNAAPGKAWIKEASKRLAPIGEREFLQRIDEWFTFPEGEVKLGAPGSAMLRLLVWYGSLVDIDCSLPILRRAGYVSWAKPDPSDKVQSALAWLLRTRGGGRFGQDAAQLCRKGATAEVQHLEAAYFPERAAARQRSEAQDQKESMENAYGRMEAARETVRAELERLNPALARDLRERIERRMAALQEKSEAREGETEKITV